jgi:hypothetical protein
VPLAKLDLIIEQKCPFIRINRRNQFCSGAKVILQAAASLPGGFNGGHDEDLWAERCSKGNRPPSKAAAPAELKGQAGLWVFHLSAFSLHSLL